jgi:ketosteroid isomerase-like protein
MRVQILLSLVLVVTTHTISFAQNYMGDSTEIVELLKVMDEFSQAVMQSDYQAVANLYSEDAHIFPTGKKIISNREAIEAYWNRGRESKIIYHKILPEEIQVIGNAAYDFGYYEGTTRNADGSEISWRGKYVILWKKVKGNWKMYVDIWNRVTED